MSDLDDFKALFDRLKIPYAMHKVVQQDRRMPTATPYLEMPPQFKGTHQHLGYYGFVADFWFDAEGKYLDFGVVE